MHIKLVTGLSLLALVFVTGCAASHGQRQSHETGTAWPLDGLAYLYSDPAAVSPIHDHPLRWIVLALHPVSVVMDYGVNRPLYSIASTSPTLFGFTPEDATLHAQRPRRNY